MNLRIPTMTRDFRVDLDPTHHQLFHLALDFFACQVELPQHVHGLLTTATMRTRADLTPDQWLLVLFQNTPDHPES
jgi:hypothetical protein